MTEEKKNEVEKTEQGAITGDQTDAPLGFEDEDEGDMIVPRIKVVQTLSPERKEKQAEEGDIINSLTKEKLNGKNFVPVFKFTNNIEWRDRAEGGGMICQSRDGKVGYTSSGERKLCKQCGRNQFDNTKEGKEAIPKCTKYINFFGFFEGERMPIILSFAKTNYAEGKKLFSLAKVTMQNMWNHSYALSEKVESKGGNEWYNMVVSPAGKTSEEDRAFGKEMYNFYRHQDFKQDYEDDEESAAASGDAASDEELNNSEF